MASAERLQLSTSEIDSVLHQPNGPYALMELVRMGRVDSQMAIEALDREGRDPLYRRLLLALVDTLFPGKDIPSR
ncbi:MAG: hypothetical protein JWN86_576 [Planctomycetota bacterium]|nr:hypothetical protein [Planctomycetota bacterium]